MLSTFGDGLYRIALAIVLSFSLLSSESAPPPEPYAVEVTATVQTDPPGIQINWPVDEDAVGYSVARKLPAASSWTPLIELPGSATSFTDTDVTLGSVFEYRVVRSSNPDINAHAYVLAGLN